MVIINRVSATVCGLQRCDMIKDTHKHQVLWLKCWKFSKQVSATSGWTLRTVTECVSRATARTMPMWSTPLARRPTDQPSSLSLFSNAQPVSETVKGRRNSCSTTIKLHIMTIKQIVKRAASWYFEASAEAYRTDKHWPKRDISPWQCCHGSKKQTPHRRYRQCGVNFSVWM